MRFILYSATFLLYLPLLAQPDFKRLDTATDSFFLRRSEREMIKEINFVRAYPRQYLKVIEPYLEQARKDYKDYGGEPTSFTVRKHYRQNNEGKIAVVLDTVWYNEYEENLKALSKLARQLKLMRPIGILRPHKGIYEAASKHSKDLEAKNWEHSHQGADGLWPEERIRLFAEEMKTGSENLYGLEGENTPRKVVVALLIDAGMKGHMHRANILNPAWTHIACYYGGLYDKKHQWVQKFAQASHSKNNKEGLP